MIKTVFFDLGGVYFTNGTKNCVNVLSKKYNIPYKDLYNEMNGKISYEYRLGKIDSNSFWKFLKDKYGFDKSEQELNNLWLSGYRPIKGTEEIVKELNDKSIELMYLSDNVEERVEYLDKKYSFLKYFSGGVFSFDTGFRKPDKEIYLKALSRTKSKPEECLFIDDKERCLKPANELGINIILFTSPSMLTKSLKRMNII